MTKLVIYNGGTQSYTGCTGNPSDLIRGKTYEVRSKEVKPFQTNYTLKGITGDFNSCWFNNVNDPMKTYPSTFLAISNVVPTKGNRCECSKLEFVNGSWQLKRWRTSTVEKVEQIGKSTYNVKTKNSVYIIEVN